MIETRFGAMRVMDAHTHFFPRSFYAGLGKMVGADADMVAERLGWERGAEPEELGRRWLSEMDRHGVERMVAIHTLPGDVEEVGRGIAATSGRLVGYVMTNPLLDVAVGVVERAVTMLGFRGVALFPGMFRFSLLAEPVQPILEIADRHALNVFVHCGVLKVGFRTKLGLPTAFDATLANPLSLQRLAGVYPRAKFIVPHLGSGMLRELLMVADQCPNVYTDTSGMGGWGRYIGLSPAQAIRRAVDVMGAQRILFGSDSTFFPRGWRRDALDQQIHAFQEAGLNEGQVRQILGENLSGML